MTTFESFPSEVAVKLGWYVYRLIDPRNGETFYVGKGYGNRVFAHVHEEQGIEGDELSNKLQRIRQIRLAHLSVVPVIHRHGMDEKTAFEVEAALIDAYPGLTNIVAGMGSNDFGPMHVAEVIRLYSAETAEFKHRALLVTVDRTALEVSLYEAARFAWRLNVDKAEQAEVVLPVVEGLIRGAFIADHWLPDTAANFPGRGTDSGRYGFVGHEARQEVLARYVGKRVPDEYRKRGAANPVRYTW